MTPIRRVGYAGLGAIGALMAQRILDAGFELHVWNRSPEKARALALAGATLAASPAALAREVEVVCLCLTDDRAVEQVVFGEQGIAAAGVAGLIVADHSTIHPAAARGLAQRWAETGGQWIDAPVSGGLTGAREGTLSVFAGGDASTVEHIRPVLMSFAGKVTRLGAAGSGQVAKACNQMVSFGTAAVLAEALNLASRLGLDVAELPRAMEGGFADSFVLRQCAPAMIHGPLVGSTLTALKDMEIAIELGRASDTPLPMVDLMTSLYRRAVEQGHLKGGLASLIRLHADGPLAAVDL